MAGIICIITKVTIVNDVTICNVGSTDVNEESGDKLEYVTAVWLAHKKHGAENHRSV
jgi:hypothetical protein